MAYEISFPIGPMGSGPMLGMGAMYGFGHTLGMGQAMMNYNNNLRLNPYLLNDNITGALADAQRNQYYANAWNGRNQQIPLDLELQRQRSLNDWYNATRLNREAQQYYRDYDPSLYQSPFFRGMTQYGYTMPNYYNPYPHNPYGMWDSGGIYGPYYGGGFDPLNPNYQPRSFGQMPSYGQLPQSTNNKQGQNPPPNYGYGL